MEHAVDIARVRARSASRWQDIVRENFLPLEFAMPARQEFYSLLTARPLGETHLASVVAGAQRVVRTPRLAEASERGYYKLFWQLAGYSRVEQGGRLGELQAGQWTYYDTARPYRIDIASGSRFAVMLLPTELCHGWRAEATGGVYSCHGAARVALATVLSVLDDEQQYDPATAECVTSTVAGLMQTALSLPSAGESAEPGKARLEQARRYIVSRLDDPTLTPDAVAAALHVSRRTLYACFAEQGESPFAYIQRVRLEFSRRLLSNPAERHQSITRIAMDSGFGDIAHFSRLFKSAYGASPRDFRKRLFG